MKQLEQIEVAIQTGDMDALKKHVKKLASSTDLEMLYDTADRLVSYGFLRKADELYLTLLEYLPNENQLKIDRANVLLEIGEEDDALLLLSEIGKSDDEYVQSLLVLADYYQMIGLAETALNKIKEAYGLVPNEPIIRFAYAELLLDAGKFAEAARMYEQLDQQVKKVGDVQIKERLAETYSAGAAYEKALPYYKELLEEKRTPNALFGTAFALYQMSEAQRAIPLLVELTEIDPDYYSAYMLLGQCYIQLQDEKKAYEIFIEGITRDEFDKELQLSAGKCALKRGQPDVAEKHLKEALALDPDYVDAAITLASLYNSQEENEKLVDLVEHMHKDIQDIPMLQAFLAYTYERTERYKEAYDLFKEVYEQLEDNEEFLAHYANFLVEEGLRGEAIMVARKIVELNPSNEEWKGFLEVEFDEEV